VMGIGFDTNRSAGDWALLVASGVLGLAIADTLFLAGLQRIDASVVAVTDCTYSPMVMLLSVLFLGDSLTLGLLIGGPLVVLGVLVVSRSKSGNDAPIDRTGVILAVLGVLTTAVGVVLAKPALDRSHLIEATCVRLLIGSTALALFDVAAGRSRQSFSLLVSKDFWKRAFGAVFMGTYVSMLLWLGGVKYGSPSRVALLNQMGAVFVLIFSRFLGEPVPMKRWIGVSVAIAGVLIVIAEPMLRASAP
jgi:drug/metabolite transporter (DMT)-like permease